MKENKTLSMGLTNAALSIFLPLLIFIAVYSVRCLFIRYSASSASYLICAVLLLVVFVPGFMAYTNLNNDDKNGFVNKAFIFACCAIAWVVAFCTGDYNYQMYMEPFHDLKRLNVYQNVDPSVYTGQQLMDAGQIDFVVGSHVNRSLSYGFKMGDNFCVAPILGPNETASKTGNYDFWAVGLNCCSGHAADFNCGGAFAHKGMRLMNDEHRGYFRLAVQEAVATYNIRSNHPVFMFWMESPSDEINAYQDDATAHFLMAIAIFAASQVGVTAFAAIAMSRIKA